MSLPVNNKNAGKGGKNSKGGMMSNSKFISKPGSTKAAGGAAKKPVKTGGSRGS